MKWGQGEEEEDGKQCKKKKKTRSDTARSNLQYFPYLLQN